MTKSVLKLICAGISLVAFLIVFFPAATFAGYTYHFSDQFNNSVFLDNNQTASVQNVNSELHLVSNALSGTVTSEVINSSGGNVASAAVLANAYLPANPALDYIEYYLSNNNGGTWHRVERSQTFTFTGNGTQLRWRADMNRSWFDKDPKIDFVTIQYTVGDASTHQSGYNGNITDIVDPYSLVCQSLGFVGLSCTAGEVAPTTIGNYSPQSAPLSFNVFGSGSNSTSPKVLTSALTGSIATAGVKDLSGNDIMLVKTANSPDIYRIANGRKHKFPTMNIFNDYGYNLDMVETISQKQLDKYPRSYLLRVHKDKKNIHYLTEGGLIRLIPNDKKVFESYGDREEDIVEISKKEFNFYPVNQFVFLEQPLNRDVFQITGNSKRYMTPMAVARLRVKDDQIAPVNQTQLVWYKTLAPVIN